MSSSTKSHRSALKKGTTTTQKRVRHSSASPEKLVFEKEFEDSDVPLLWTKNPKQFDEVIYDELEEEFKENNPFTVKNKSETDNMSPKKKEEYELSYDRYKKLLKVYKKQHYKEKRMDIGRRENSRRANKESHYYKIKNFDKIPVQPKKSRRSGASKQAKQPFPEKSTDPTNAIEVRRSEPVPTKKIEPRVKPIISDVRSEKKPVFKKQGGLSGFFSSATSFFSGNKTVGGKHKHKRSTQKRK
jgi:hypothetical protein